MLSPEQITHYLKDPTEKSLSNAVVEMYCKGVMQRHTDKYMERDDSRFKTFSAMWSSKTDIVQGFTVRNWMLSDMGIYKSIGISFRDLHTPSPTNIMIFAKFVRMAYFIQYSGGDTLEVKYKNFVQTFQENTDVNSRITKITKI